ncbi:MAG: acyl-CoA thioesterase [Polyangiaceae bacterium]|nr:acyl-CoA thioesterase [Polyangiaceae bacterium]MCK6534336.1 acyl-CoA thioesterase [Polyangiaceae bacterium]
MKVFSTRLRVRYADTDTSGIVYYASYFLYFETGRVEMFRELGLPYDYHLPIVETACRYRAPARFDDLLEVHSFVEGTRSKGFRIGHRVHRVQSDGALELLVEGHTSMVTVGEDRKPVPLPPRFVEAFAAG